ncbi:class I SAM-dependent methyltransferase [Chitinophaga niabensis]|uniref:Methyltransferase domain-containing protein n=1 Tax=Chitinophaga niabensis TaxID=536979 RepID=A0A1N6JXD9_9BACT|nr:class I SAM-dependent methyltransferase [Chitinophaga niabensis]SIO49012.1 Methyltransferase domain-containing protein [Chitinophaga niabensis]
MDKVLYDKEVAKEFYEARFSNGYMDDWEIQKKQRIFKLLKELPLPSTGRLLDFGCGNGVFTDVLKQALPGWDVFGSDISEVAIKHATERYPDLTFYVSDDNKVSEHVKDGFDFIFSHHVLEHVYDIEKAVAEINSLLRPQAYMFLIFPCGNTGSLEHTVASLRTDGINKDMENVFFYEDPGHVRRLTSDQTASLFGKFGFKLTKEFYANQFHGAIKMISQMAPNYVLNFTNTATAKDAQAKNELQKIRRKLIFKNLIQLPANLFNIMKNKKHKTAKHYFILIVDAIPAIFSYPFYAYHNWKSEQEWLKNKEAKNGSEMYLFFKR